MKTYPEILRDLREDKDLSQATLGKQLGMTQQQYSNYEAGISDLPSRVLLKLAEFYGVSTDYILGRTKSTRNLNALNERVDANHTVGEIVSDLLALDETGRLFVIESLALQKVKAEIKRLDLKR